MEKIIPPVTLRQILDVEIRSSALLIKFLPQEWAIRYFMWKSSRKFNRYLISKNGEIAVKTCQCGHLQQDHYFENADCTKNWSCNKCNCRGFKR